MRLLEKAKKREKRPKREFSENYTEYNVELVEIRESDGAQRYEFPYTETMGKQFKPPYNSIWLTGFNRASDVKVGDKGVLKYESRSCRGMKYGLYFFYKEKKE